jgi:hypothetical protein
MAGALAKPERALDAMEALDDKLPPECGGWRELNKYERAALAFAEYGKENDLSGVFVAMESLMRHPAILAGCSFCHGGLVPQHMTDILRLIYDARRFVDPEHPGRCSKLKSFFGLSGYKSYVRAVKKKTATRSHLAGLGWLISPYRVRLPGLFDYKDPGAFLFRRHQEIYNRIKRAHSDENAALRATWETTQLFLDWIWRLWLAKVNGEALRPELFLRETGEQESFKTFIEKINIAFDKL